MALIRKFRRAEASEDVFRDLLSGITSGATPQEVLDQLAERTARLVHATGVYIERLDDERQQLISAALYGMNLPPVGTRGPYRGSIAEQAITRGGPIIIRNVQRESRSLLGTVHLPFPALVLPISAHHTPIGALIIIRPASAFTSKDVARLEAFADLAAVSLRRIIMMNQLEQQRVELQKALQTREELIRILAHDLRNPINTIAMAASALQNNQASESAFKNLCEMIDRSTKRMNRLIQDVLDEALIERAGALPINPQPHSAHSLAEEVCETSRMQARTKTVSIECHISDHAMVYADRDRLLQVLTNLMDNAIKFTPKGGRIMVKSQTMQDHVRFSVSDTGPGIPETYRDKIFEPYFQVPGNSHRGSGLGLAIAKRIVEQHGGSIWFETTEGQGTTFIFTIPAKSIAA